MLHSYMHNWMYCWSHPIRHYKATRSRLLVCPCQTTHQTRHLQTLHNHSNCTPMATQKEAMDLREPLPLVAPRYPGFYSSLHKEANLD